MRKFAAEKSKSLLAHRKLSAAVLQHPTVSSLSSPSLSHSRNILPHSSLLLRFLSTTSAANSSESMATDYSSTPVKIDSINPKVICFCSFSWFECCLVLLLFFVVLYWFLSFSSELVIWVFGLICVFEWGIWVCSILGPIIICFLLVLVIASVYCPWMWSIWKWLLCVFVVSDVVFWIFWTFCEVDLSFLGWGIVL